MDTLPPSCQLLIDTWLAGHDNALIMVEHVGSCDPLALLRVLHQAVLHHVLSDLGEAARLTQKAWLVVKSYPDDPLVRAQAHWTQANAILYIPDYVRALAHFDQALEHYDVACRRLAPQEPA